MEKETKKIGTEIVKAVETMKMTGGKNVSAKAKETKEQASADLLQNEIAQKTKELQKCLAELEHKKELSDKRSKFMNALDALENAGEKLTEEVGFETHLYKLRFSDAATYRDTEAIFSISNTVILREFVVFVKAKVKEQIARIEQELING
ncbi:MAG: hypothetical protein IJZ86_01230 [Bacteroides sp.]|nr:hypothetical protein [Bacteroides sp.]